jgi:hypothetical protein
LELLRRRGTDENRLSDYLPKNQRPPPKLPRRLAGDLAASTPVWQRLSSSRFTWRAVKCKDNLQSETE